MAKESMRYALDGLSPNDTFNLITFSGDTEVLFPAACSRYCSESCDGEAVPGEPARAEAAPNDEGHPSRIGIRADKQGRIRFRVLHD